MSTTALPAIARASGRSTVVRLLVDAFRRLASRPALACFAVFVLTLGLRAALMPWLHPPRAAIHDEFSYLLAADTYANGRLANPPHPFWEHFESFHIIQQPTYASKYQPLQGMALAVGEKLFRNPWFGVWISAALMCAATCWMLQGWLSPGWALLGAFLLCLRVGIFGYWMNSYWGGAVPAIGGALVLGALARIVFKDQILHTATLAAGLAVLFNSRPFDALVLGVMSALALSWWIVRKNSIPVSIILKKCALPVIGIGIVAAAFTAYNNYRVTGNALELPYQVHERQYNAASMLAFSKAPSAPVYRHAVMQKFWVGWNLPEVNAIKANLLNALLEKFSLSYGFLFGLYPLMVAPLVWPFALKTTEERFTVLLLAGFFAALIPVTGFAPHYIAAAAGLIYARFLQGMSRLNQWDALGGRLGPAIAVFFLALIPFQFGLQLWDLLKNGEEAPLMGLMREQTINTLDRQPGRKLVLVRYSANHNVHEEWVYNGANIDSQKIVWAREMGPEKDAPFVRYFHDRQVWLAEPDQSPPKLTPYRLELGKTDNP